MREIEVKTVEKSVAALCITANTILGNDIEKQIRRQKDIEVEERPRAILEELLENAAIAREKGLPICQDTGMAVVYMQIGQDVHFVGGFIEEAINRGVAAGYSEGCLRASVVSDPILRKNTGDNTPAVILWDIVPGDHVDITVAPKGFGSENMSSLTMLSPSQGLPGVKEAILSTVRRAGPNPCPPIILGVGIGGTMDMAARLAKLALLRPVGSKSPLEHIQKLEEELLFEINEMNIGPAGLGGRTTALAVHINTYPTHIAGLPVAVNMSCHATRHAHIRL
jgi:fumarate hydratase subunit alpha